MAPLKKIDYRELAEEAPQAAPAQTEEVHQAMPEAGERVSFFASLKNRWALMDKKTKIEFSIFAVVVLLMISFFAYYIIAKVSVSRGKLPPEALNMPEEQIPPDTAPETEFLIP